MACYVHELTQPDVVAEWTEEENGEKIIIFKCASYFFSPFFLMLILSRAVHL